MNNESLKRSTSNPSAVLNTDANGLKAYREARERVRQRNKDFDNLKTEVAELKSMLGQILEKLDR